MPHLGDAWGKSLGGQVEVATVATVATMESPMPALMPRCEAGKSPGTTEVLTRKSSINGRFPIAMFDYRMVSLQHPLVFLVNMTGVLSLHRHAATWLKIVALGKTKSFQRLTPEAQGSSLGARISVESWVVFFLY